MLKKGEYGLRLNEFKDLMKGDREHGSRSALASFKGEKKAFVQTQDDAKTVTKASTFEGMTDPGLTYKYARGGTDNFLGTGKASFKQMNNTAGNFMRSYNKND